MTFPALNGVVSLRRGRKGSQRAVTSAPAPDANLCEGFDPCWSQTAENPGSRRLLMARSAGYFDHSRCCFTVLSAEIISVHLFVDFDGCKADWCVCVGGGGQEVA